MKVEEVFSLIAMERARQDAQWGPLPRHLSHTTWLTVMAEEFGEVARAILHHDHRGIAEELIHVLAVGVAWLCDEVDEKNWDWKAG